VTASELEALLLERAATLEDAEVVQVEGGLELHLDGNPFAALAGDVVELRLRPGVAAAALHTPGTASSPRGPGWVGFAPRDLDEFARDRAAAWLESAWRFADDDEADENGADDDGAADDGGAAGDDDRAGARTLA
jgi:hypothetical protein